MTKTTVICHVRMHLPLLWSECEKLLGIARLAYVHAQRPCTFCLCLFPHVAWQGHEYPQFELHG